MLKELTISAIAGAMMLASSAGAFAYHHGSSNTLNLTSDSYNTSTKTITVTKATISNDAFVINHVYSISNSGLNFTSTDGGLTTGGDATSGNATKDGTSGYATSGGTTGGSTKSVVLTGDAGAQSTVTNVVNTTRVSFQHNDVFWGE